MSAYLPACSTCGDRKWTGDPPRCGACGQPLVRDAIGVDHDRVPELDAPLDGRVARLVGSHRLANHPASHRLLFGLLAASLEECRRDDDSTFLVGYAIGPLLLALGVALGLGSMAGAWWLSQAAGGGAGGWALYGLPVAVLILARYLRGRSEEPTVDLETVDGKVVGLRLGRLREVFHAGATPSLLLYLGGAFGAMWGVLWFTPDRGGLPVEAGGGDGFWLTLDNLCHGVFLDVCELYDLRFGAKVAHTRWSATVFNAFRMAFDTLVLLFLYQSWVRWRLRRLFLDLPEPREFAALLHWLTRVCADRDRLPGAYMDEVIFLVIAKEYLSGNALLARQLSTQFPQLPVSRRVRELFRGPAGEVIFQGRFAG